MRNTQVLSPNQEGAGLHLSGVSLSENKKRSAGRTMETIMHKLTVLAAAIALFVPAIRAETLTPGAPTDFTVTFDYNGGSPIIKGSFKAPTTSYSWSDPQPITEIGKIEVTRGCYEVGESDLPIYSVTSPQPGAQFEFTDTEEIEYGHQYTYTVRAYSTDNTGGGGDYVYLFVGIKPAKPTVTLSAGENGSSPVTIKVTAPTTLDGGGELTAPLTKLEIKDYVSYGNEPVLHTIENPVPGTEYTYVHEAENSKSYIYHVYASTAYGTSDYASAQIYVGEDVPGAPENVAAATTSEGGVSVTWTAPTAGKNSGYLDTASIRYKVARVIGYNSETLLAENLTDCAYTDPCEDLTGPTTLKYKVTAYNTLGDGGYTTSAEVVAGPAISLPFVENFNAGSDYYKQAENLWTKDPVGYSSNWSVERYDYSTSITGVDGSEDNYDGYASASYRYSSPGTVDRFISSSINFAGAEYPVLTFYTLANATNANHLAVDVRRDGAEDETLVDIAPNSLYTDGSGDNYWTMVTVPMMSLTDKVASVIFRAYVPEGNTDNSDNIFLDKIRIDNYPAVKNVVINSGDNQTVLSWDVPSCSTGEASAYKLEIFTADGNEEVTASTPEYTMTTVMGENYQVVITPVYGDVEGLATEYAFVGGAGTGVEGISADAAVAVEYLDMAGMRVAQPIDGTLVIKRMVMADGSVKAVKEIYRAK